MKCKETKCFSERLRLLLYEREIKVTELAKVIGRERQTIHNYISGHSEPRLTEIIRIAKHFGVTPDYLLGIEEKPAIERVKQEWISVKDRLPECHLTYDIFNRPDRYVSDVVLVSVKSEEAGGTRYFVNTDIMTGRTEEDIHWLESCFYGGSAVYGQEITAWMPLPEPYGMDGE